MSFWVGIAEGFKDAEAANERQMERDYRLEQDKKADERYQSERDYRTDRDRISDQRYEQQRQDQLDALRIERMIKLGLGKPSTGGTGSGGKSKGKSGGTADELVAESIRLQDRIENDDNASMEVVQWFDSVDPATRAAAMGFIRSQEKNTGVPYNLDNLVDDFRIISQTGGNEDEIRKRIETGELDVANPDDFIEAMQSIKPLLTVTSVPTATSAYDTAEAARVREQVPQIVMDRLRMDPAAASKLQEFDLMENPENARIELLQYAAQTGLLQKALDSNPVYSRYKDQFDPFLSENPLNAPIGGGMAQEGTQTQANPQQDAMSEPVQDPVVTQTEQATRQAPTPQTEEEAYRDVMKVLDANNVILDEVYEAWLQGQDFTKDFQEADAAANVPEGTTLALLESIKLGRQEQNLSGVDEFSGVDMSTDGVSKDRIEQLPSVLDDLEDEDIRSITQTVLRQDTDMYQELLDKYSVEELDEIVQKGMILLYG